VVVLAQVLRDVAGTARELLQVLPDAEPLAGSRDHDGAHRRIGGLLETVLDAAVHGAGERVEDVGAVQRDRQDGAVARDLHLGHSRGNHNRALP
jgi:hypothetical protein